MKGRWTKKWTVVMGDPDRDGSLHKDEWGATLSEERKVHINPHALIPEHRKELISTILHECLHIILPGEGEEKIEMMGSRLAELFIANPHLHHLLSRYKPTISKVKCKCGKS